MKDEETKKLVREGYAKIAQQGRPTPADSCCSTADRAVNVSRKMGYSDKEINAVPEGANMGLGCGNPIAIASLKEGETVLDLGAGPGFDCFLAAEKVGKSGQVIGVDVTQEMLEKARENAAKGGYTNVEFRLGEIENLPAADNSVDIVISNCVINLSPDRAMVFCEAFRVLRPDGRIMVSDIALSKELPEFIRDSDYGYIGCISGAVLKDEYLEAIRNAGFQEVELIDQTPMPVDYTEDDPVAKTMIEHLKISREEVKDVTDSIMSIKVKAVKKL